MEKNTLTTYEIAQYAQVTPRTVIQWINEGKLSAYRTPGNHSRVSFEAFFDFLKKYNMPVPKELVNMRQTTDQKRILIVDDDKSIVDSIRRILMRDKTYELEFAYDGFEAGEKFVKHNPHLITLDLNMPGVNGYQLCERIRKGLNNVNVKILIISATCEGSSIKKIIGLGADDYLPKPFRMDELKIKIVNLLGGSSESVNKEMR